MKDYNNKPYDMRDFQVFHESFTVQSVESKLFVNNRNDRAGLRLVFDGIFCISDRFLFPMFKT